MLTARSQLAAAQAPNGMIYAVGGEDGTTALTTVEQYDPSKNTWTAKASLPVGRYVLGVVTGQDGMIYALGGATTVGDPSEWSQEVDQYNPTTDSWTRKHDLAIPFAEEGALGGDGVIYGFGNGGACVAYSPSTDTSWVCATDPTQENGPAVAPAPDGTIHVLGGNISCVALTTNQQFSPATDAYTAQSPMLVARDYHRAALGINGRIYVVGGTPGCDGATDTVQEYDPATDTWQYRASVPTARASPGVVGSSDRKLYVIGGNNSSGHLATVEVAVLP
jgi:hypothetical protein